jgi:transcriptional regulator with XRE-family HTH domain
MGTNAKDAGAPLNRALANEIRGERNRQRLTQEKLGEMAGIPRATYTRLEAGTRAIDVQQLNLIATALRMPPSRLVERAERAVLEQSVETDEAAIARMARVGVERRVADRRVGPRRAVDRGETG